MLTNKNKTISQKFSRKISGFNLIELLITITVMSILSSIGYFSYKQYIVKNNRILAKTALFTIAQKIEWQSLDDLTYNNQAKIKTLNDSEIKSDYLIEDKALTNLTLLYQFTVIFSGNRAYLIKADPKPNRIMAGDGRLELSSTGRFCWYSKKELQSIKCNNF